MLQGAWPKFSEFPHEPVFDRLLGVGPGKQLHVVCMPRCAHVSFVDIVSGGSGWLLSGAIGEAHGGFAHDAIK